MFNNINFLFAQISIKSACFFSIEISNVHLNMCHSFYSTETPGHAGWAETPRTDRAGDVGPHETPTPAGGKRRSRWDETPAGSQTPMTPRTPATGGGTPVMTPSGKTPVGPSAMGMVTPSCKYSPFCQDLLINLYIVRTCVIYSLWAMGIVVIADKVAFFKKNY